jgi:hypothetical protein
MFPRSFSTAAVYKHLQGAWRSAIDTCHAAIIRVVERFIIEVCSPQLYLSSRVVWHYALEVAKVGFVRGEDVGTVIEILACHLACLMVHGHIVLLAYCRCSKKFLQFGGINKEEPTNRSSGSSPLQ